MTQRPRKRTGRRVSRGTKRTGLITPEMNRSIRRRLFRPARGSYVRVRAEHREAVDLNRVRLPQGVDLRVRSVHEDDDNGVTLTLVGPEVNGSAPWFYGVKPEWVRRVKGPEVAASADQLDARVFEGLTKDRPEMPSGIPWEHKLDMERRGLLKIHGVGKTRFYLLTPKALALLSDRNLKPEPHGEARSAAEEAFWARCRVGNEGRLRRALDDAWAAAGGRPFVWAREWTYYESRTGAFKVGADGMWRPQPGENTLRVLPLDRVPKREERTSPVRVGVRQEPGGPKRLFLTEVPQGCSEPLSEEAIEACVLTVLDDGGAHPRLAAHLRDLLLAGLYGTTLRQVVVRLVEERLREISQPSKIGGQS